MDGRARWSYAGRSVERVTESGLVVVHERARTGPPDPLAPIDVSPPAIDASYVMYPYADVPVQASRWAGWPVGWVAPWSSGGAGGLAMLGRLVSTVGTCADLNARSLADMPVVVDRAGIPVTPQPSWAENPEPEVYAHVGDFTKQAVMSLLLRGEAIIAATARYADGWPSRFIVLDPDQVNVERANGIPEYSIAGAAIPRADVCHVRYQSWPANLRGVGPLSWAARNTVSAAALEQYGADLATRGGIPWGVLSHPQPLTKDQADQLRDSYVAASRDRRGAPAILSGGLKLDTLTLSPTDMALLDLRVFDEQRIAAAMGVPANLAGLPSPSGLTYSTTVGLFEFWWRSTLRPLGRNLSRALSAWALPRGTSAYYDADDFLRPDMASMVQAMVMLHSIQDPTGIALTAAEARRWLRILPADPVTDDDPDPDALVSLGLPS